jgi:hypothetical protein
MGRVIDSSIDKVGEGEVRARVLNQAGNVGQAKAKSEDEAVAKALQEADRKGKESDQGETEDDDGEPEEDDGE